MTKREFGDGRWVQVGEALRFCDPIRYASVLRAAEQIIRIYRETTFGVLPPCVAARNDNG